MRDAFAREIEDIACRDERVVLLSGDIGNRMFDSFKTRFPIRFYNVGVAEANMISVAAGLALCGLRPVTYTIAAFNTLRCLEQIRVDVCYQKLPVIIVGVGGGLSYASLNATHHALEDIACMRVLPEMTVLCPGDAMEVRGALRAALHHQGPVYIRLGKKGEAIVHNEVPQMKIGRGLWIRRRGDANSVCLFSTGNLLPTAIQVADYLERRGITTSVASMPTVKPLDIEMLAEAFRTSRLVVTLEEHSLLGGFGSSIAEWWCEHANGTATLLRLGTEDRFLYEATEQEHARRCFGITTEQIADRITGKFADP